MRPGLQDLMMRAALCLLPTGLAAAEPASAPVAPPAIAPAKKEPVNSEWVFSILPKSFQKNPLLELTVITEMTEAGKKLPPVSPNQPAYVELFSSGYKALGDAPMSAHTLPQEELERVLLRSLATNGYLPAKPPAQPASLVIFYTWGSHGRMDEPDAENPVYSGEQLARNILDRASLVGGEKFARELLDLFQQADAMSSAGNAPVPPGGEAVMTPEMMAFANPVNLFRMRSAKNEFLLDQTANDVYYVVASAYDHRALAAGRRLLYWRTRMTVAAQGVSQEQTLPTLVLTAAPYFGKDMPEAETLNKRTMREGTVEVGTPVVVPDAPAPSAPPVPRR